MLQPMLYAKNATQQGIALTLNPAVLYRGVGVSIGNMAVLTAAQFPLSAAIGKAITGGEDRPLTRGEKRRSAACSRRQAGIPVRVSRPKGASASSRWR